MTTDTDRERVIDARVQRRLATDAAYRNAENAEQQQQREDEITAQEEQRFGAYLDDVAPMTPAEELAARREARGDADPLNRLRAHNAAAIAAGAVPIVDELNPLEEHGASVRAEIAEIDRDRGTALAILARHRRGIDPATISNPTERKNVARALAILAAAPDDDAAELEEERRPTVAEIIGADLEQRAELLELADAALHALAREETRLETKLKRLEAVKLPKYESLHAHELEDCRRELETTTRALAIARKHSPKRNALLAAVLKP